MVALNYLGCHPYTSFSLWLLFYMNGHPNMANGSIRVSLAYILFHLMAVQVCRRTLT